MFQPGYRVSSAETLESATVWVETINPDLIVIDPSVAPASDFGSWWIDHDLGARHTLVYEGAPADINLGEAIVHAPAGLSAFMRAVRECVDPPEPERAADHNGSAS